MTTPSTLLPVTALHSLRGFVYHCLAPRACFLICKMGDITIVFQTMGNPEKLINLCFEGMCFKHCLNIYSFSRRSLQNGGSVREDVEISLGKEIVGLGWCSAGSGLRASPWYYSRRFGRWRHLYDRRISLHFSLCGDLNYFSSVF